MSRIGRKPVPIVSGVTVKVDGNTLKVRGPRGEMQQGIDPRVSVQIEDGNIIFSRADDSRPSRALHGLYRSLAANMCEGVTGGFTRGLDVVGTGYGAKVEGGKLVLAVGFCHPVSMAIPQGMEVTCPSATQIQITGMDKQQVGDFAARIRKVRPPEPYKGKGIKYSTEIVRRKAGKTLAGK